ncbi:MAG: type II secretion system secretin GspD [Myxococcota bacterium]
MNFGHWLRSCSVLAALTPAVAHAAPAADRPEPPSSEPLSPVEPRDTCKKQSPHAKFRITLDREARLVDLVRWMSSVSCTKFIWSPAVRDGKVTVVSPEPVTMQQAYAAFYAALETMGLTVEESGRYLKIVESKTASREVVPVYRPGQSAPVQDRFVTQLYRPHEGRVGDVVSVIEHLKGERGTVTAVGDLIIITDTGTSIDRMLKVVREVDVAPGERDAIFMMPLRHAEPEEIARIVGEVFMDKSGPSSGASSSKGKTKTKGKAKSPPASSSRGSTGSVGVDEARVTGISIDARTRTLLITAPRAGFPTVRRFIERLDVPVPDDGGTLFVLPLKHADPEEIAQVLGNLPTKGGAGGQGKPGANAAPAPGGVSIGGEIHITADPSTRSLVVMASTHDFLALRRVVEALDVERRLVYIEAFILELSTEHSFGTDASAHYGSARDDGTLGFVGSSPGNLNSAVLDTSILTGLAAGVIGPALPGSDIFGLGQDLPSFGVVIQALETNKDVNLVSDPHLYTSDNKTARMEVGQKIPVPVGSNTVNGINPVTTTQYTREDIALKLEVTPHVGEGGALTLDIMIENQEVDNPNAEGGPTTNKRRLELEEVIARDGQPVVLGGLVQEKEEIAERRVPGLGAIPLLGWLFKKHDRIRRKTNLLVVLVPHVLDSPDDARRIHARRIAERRELLERETAFKRRDLDAHVNYRRKSGLLAAVHAESRRMNEEATLRQDAEAQIERSVAHSIAPDGVYEVTAAPEPAPAAPEVDPRLPTGDARP